MRTSVVKCGFAAAALGLLGTSSCLAYTPTPPPKAGDMGTLDVFNFSRVLAPSPFFR